MAKLKIPSLGTLEDLATRAAGGDNEALRRLGKESERLNRALNQRMRTLEKAGKTGDAYKLIKEAFGGKTRGSQARTGSAEQLFRNARSAASALGYKESTLGGIREVDTKTANKVAQHFGHKEPLTKSQVDNLNKFMASDAWKEMVKVFGSDSPTAGDAVDLILNGEDELRDAFMEAISGYDDHGNIFDTLDGFVDF